MAEDPITEMAKDLVSKLPVEQAYNEIVSPAAQQTGSFAGDLVATLRLALAPVQVGAYYQKRLELFLQRSLDQVEERNRVRPAPQILGPVIEAIRYEPEGTSISAMFEALLAKAMDRASVELAHSAFPQIIRQMTSDEAVFLKAIAQPYLSAGQRFHRRVTTRRVGGQVSDTVNEVGLVHPHLAETYLSHLTSLGLLSQARPENHVGEFDDPQDNLDRSDSNRSEGMKEFDAYAVVHIYELSPLGRLFVLAITPA